MLYLYSIFIIIISYFLFKNIAGSMAFNRLNLFSMSFYYSLILMSYIGATLIANGYGNNPVLAHVSDENRILGWIIVSYVMLALPLGAYLGKKLFQIKNMTALFNQYTFSPLKPSLSKNDSHIKFLLYLLSFISSLSILYVVYKVGSIPQLKIVNVISETEVLAIRTSINRNFDGIYQIKSIFFEQMVPLLSFISFGYWRMTRKKTDLLWFSIMLLLTLFVLTFTLSKSPLVGYIIGFVIFIIYLDGYIKWKNLIFLFFLSIILIITMFFLVIRGVEFNLVLQHLFDRTIFHQVSGVFLMLEIFPDVFQHLGITSLSKPLSYFLLNTHSEPSTRIAMEFVFQQASDNGLMNLLSTLFVGEAWANFGSYGVLISPIYIGFILSIFYIYILKSNKTPILVALLAHMSFNTNLTLQFNQYIYNSTVFSILIILLAVYIFGFILQRVRHGKKN
jgi:hypothetical protein